MEIRGERRLIPSRVAVWQALNDLDLLRECIPECQKLERVSDTTRQLADQFFTIFAARFEQEPAPETAAGAAEPGAAARNRRWFWVAAAVAAGLCLATLAYWLRGH